MSATAPSVTRERRGSGFSVLRHRNFTVFFVGAFVSSIGSWMQNVAIPAVLYDLTGSLSLAGLATLLEFLPFALLGPVGGVLADRYSRRMILIVSQTVAGILALILYLTWIGEVRSVPLLIGVAALSGAVGGLMLPSWMSFVTQLVPRDVLPEAISLNSLQYNMSRAFGPILAAVVLHQGAQWAFLANAVSYLAVVGGLVLVNVIDVHRREVRLGVVAHIARGVSTVRQSRTLSLATGLVFCIGFLGMPIISLMPAFAKDVFHYESADSGYLTGALGTGAIVGVVAIAKLKTTWSRSRLAVAGIAVYGAGLVVLTLLGSFIVALPVLFIAGAGFLMVVVTLQTAVQLSITDQMRGSVIALYFMAFGLGLPLGAALQGVISDQVGVRPTVGVAGGCLVLMALALHLNKSLSNELNKEISHDESQVLAQPEVVSITD